ncbi:hypothetical protein [uncultured Gulosibacter sp.]|uniref:hypothetical protein n=1 Tax=uncultured Gulosibacter sp. TaxID=1339167 RepID=UPI00288A98AF|nr:hypothetical protein [uncultured Gulosibacter sp.]
MLESRAGDLSALAARLDSVAAELSAAIKLNESAGLVAGATPGTRAAEAAPRAMEVIVGAATEIVEQLDDAANAALITEQQFAQTDVQQAHEMAGVWQPVTGRYGDRAI